MEKEMGKKEQFELISFKFRDAASLLQSNTLNTNMSTKTWITESMWRVATVLLYDFLRNQ